MRGVTKKAWGTIAKAASNLDSRDAMLLAGLAMVSAALVPFSIEAAIGIPGAVLVAVAIFGVR